MRKHFPQERTSNRRQGLAPLFSGRGIKKDCKRSEVLKEPSVFFMLKFQTLCV